MLFSLFFCEEFIKTNLFVCLFIPQSFSLYQNYSNIYFKQFPMFFFRINDCFGSALSDANSIKFHIESN